MDLIIVLFRMTFFSIPFFVLCAAACLVENSFFPTKFAPLGIVSNETDIISPKNVCIGFPGPIIDIHVERPIEIPGSDENEVRRTDTPSSTALIV